MRQLLPFLAFYLVIHLTGCASNYRDELQTELDLYNRDILSQLEMGAISYSIAELEIKEEWTRMEKHMLLAEHHYQQFTATIKCLLGWVLLDTEIRHGHCQLLCPDHAGTLQIRFLQT